MWMATVDGFLSAVQHNTDPDTLVVRGRTKDDVRALAQYATVALHLPTDPDTLITTYDGSDYPFRVMVPKTTWAQYVGAQALAIDYGNFKSAVAKVSTEHAAAYHNVWTDLLALEHTDPESTRGHSPYDFTGSSLLDPDWREDQDSPWWPGADAEGPEVDDDWAPRTPVYASIHDVPLNQDPTQD